MMSYVTVVGLDMVTQISRHCIPINYCIVPEALPTGEINAVLLPNLPPNVSLNSSKQTKSSAEFPHIGLFYDILCYFTFLDVLLICFSPMLATLQALSFVPAGHSAPAVQLRSRSVVARHASMRDSEGNKAIRQPALGSTGTGLVSHFHHDGNPWNILSKIRTNSNHTQNI